MTLFLLFILSTLWSTFSASTEKEAPSVAELLLKNAHCNLANENIVNILNLNSVCSEPKFDLVKYKIKLNYDSSALLCAEYLLLNNYYCNLTKSNSKVNDEMSLILDDKVKLENFMNNLKGAYSNVKEFCNHTVKISSEPYNFNFPDQDQEAVNTLFMNTFTNEFSCQSFCRGMDGNATDFCNFLFWILSLSHQTNGVTKVAEEVEVSVDEKSNIERIPPNGDSGKTSVPVISKEKVDNHSPIAMKNKLEETISNQKLPVVGVLESNSSRTPASDSITLGSLFNLAGDGTRNSVKKDMKQPHVNDNVAVNNVAPVADDKPDEVQLQNGDKQMPNDPSEKSNLNNPLTVENVGNTDVDNNNNNNNINIGQNVNEKNNDRPDDQGVDQENEQYNNKFDDQKTGNDDEDEDNVNGGDVDVDPKEGQQLLPQQKAQFPEEDSIIRDASFLRNRPPNEDMKPGGSNFFTYFFSMGFVCGFMYIIFHNKKKIVALAVEGRRGRPHGGGRRRPNTAAYSKLDCNLEEAMVSNVSQASVTHVLY